MKNFEPIADISGREDAAKTTLTHATRAASRTDVMYIAVWAVLNRSGIAVYLSSNEQTQDVSETGSVQRTEVWSRIKISTSECGKTNVKEERVQASCKRHDHLFKLATSSSNDRLGFGLCCGKGNSDVQLSSSSFAADKMKEDGKVGRMKEDD